MSHWPSRQAYCARAFWGRPSAGFGDGRGARRRPLSIPIIGLKIARSRRSSSSSAPIAAELHDLQIADAVEHLQRLELNEVAPIRAPRGLAAASLLSLAAAVLIACWPSGQSRTEAALLPAPDNIVAAAEKIQQSLQDLEDVANHEDSKELKDLVVDLKKKAEQMKEPGVDERQALAKLSEMQAAVQALAAQLNSAVIDGQMQSLGSALASASAFEGRRPGFARRETGKGRPGTGKDRRGPARTQRGQGAGGKTQASGQGGGARGWARSARPFLSWPTA